MDIRPLSIWKGFQFLSQLRAECSSFKSPPWFIVWVTLCVNCHSAFLWCGAGGNGSALFALNVFLPKVTRHFNIEPLCPWLSLCSTGRWTESWSITSQRLYLVLGHLGLFSAVVAVLCAIWVILRIDPNAVSNYLWACVGLWLCVCVFCWKLLSCVSVLLTGHWPINSTLWIMLGWTAQSAMQMLICNAS